MKVDTELNEVPTRTSFSSVMYSWWLCQEWSTRYILKWCNHGPTQAVWLCCLLFVFHMIILTKIIYTLSINVNCGILFSLVHVNLMWFYLHPVSYSVFYVSVLPVILCWGPEKGFVQFSIVWYAFNISSIDILSSKCSEKRLENIKFTERMSCNSSKICWIF